MNNQPLYQNSSPVVESLPNEKTQLVELEEHEKYFIYSKWEIARLLREMAKRPDIITAYFEGGQRYLLTAVLGVLPEQNLVVFDYGADERLNAMALQSERLLCVARNENVLVKFSCQGPRRAKFQGKPAFAVPIPDSVYRPQRREFFRVHVPAHNSATLQVAWGDGNSLEEEIPLFDIGGGGIGLIDRRSRMPVQPDDRWLRCKLYLPETDPVAVDLEVRYSLPLPQADGVTHRRIGCRFLTLRGDGYATIQRFMHKLQVEQKT